MHSTTIRTCEYCHKEFEAKTVRRKYCSTTCKTYASHVRNGKREAPIIAQSENEPLSEERQKELLEEAARLNQAVIEMQSRKEACQKFLDNLSYRNKYHKQQRADELYDLLLLPKLDKSVRKEAEEELELLTKEIEDIELYNQQLSNQAKAIEAELENSFLPSFRALERRNQFIKTHIFNQSELAGNAIDQYQNIQTRYPFKGMNHRLFDPMGNPAQPFIALITGRKGTGKSILATLICAELIECFKSKILFVADDQNQEAVLEYFTSKKFSSDLLSIKFANTLGDIESALSKGEYEFIFIDSNHHFRLNESNFRKLRKLYPFLSVFLITRYKTNSIAELSTMEFNVQNNSDPGIGVIRYAWVDIYVNGVMSEDQHCSVFTHDETQGFQISI